MSTKPLVVLQSRDFNKTELALFYQFFTNVVIINAFNINKKVTDFTINDVVIVDIRIPGCRDWYSQNLKLLNVTVDNIVWCRLSAQSVKKDDKDEFYNSIRFENKRLQGNFLTRNDFMHALLQTSTTPVIQTRGKKILQALFKCICGTAKN